MAQSLHLIDISRRFGDIVALDRTSMHVEAGELMALLGPSGCGKTTALRIIAGLETPDTGTVLVGDRDIGRLPPNHRGLGMMFQDYSLFPHMTVGENVGFGLRMAGINRVDMARRVRDMLQLVRLANFEERYPAQLSGGQQQRVALARSLVVNPLVLLLDEPLGALDKNLRESMQFELRRIQQTLGITTVMVTHDQEEALTLSDRVTVMDQGRVLQVGTPREVYDHPRTRFVSEFLGTANVFEAHVVSTTSGDAALRLTGGGQRGDVRAHGTLQPGARVSFAVRPEKLLLSPDDRVDGNKLDGRVVGHVFRGTFHAYEVMVVGRAEPIFVYRQARGIGEERLFAIGEPVVIAWSPDATILFEENG